MKNLIIALSLFFAVGASAQTKTKKAVATKEVSTVKETIDPRVSIETAAQKNLNDLIAFTPVNAQTQSALKDLFITKYQMLEQANLSNERKNVVKEGIEYRLSILLEPATFEKIKSNQALYSSLTN